MPWGAVAAIGAAVVSNALAPDPKSPDYGPQAEASKYSADLSYQLGNRQLDQAQAQYDANMRIAQPVIDTQLKIMQQGLSQGDDYYNYGKSFRPLEQEMAAQARGGLTAADIVRMNKMGLGNLAQAAPRLPAPAAAPGAAPMPAAPAPSGGAVYGGTDRTIQPVDLTNPDVRRTAASAGGAIVAREQAAPTMVSAGGSFGGGGGSFGPTRVDEANGIRYYADGSSEKMGADELYAYQNRDKVQAALLQTTGNGGGGVQYHSPEPQGQGEPGLPRFVQNYNPQQIKEEAEAAERMRLQTQAAAPAQPGGMSAAEIAAATAAQRAGILTNATAAWQKQQDARRAELQKQLDAAKQEEQAIQAKAIADAQAKTAGLSMSYIDAQGNVRAADSYRNIKAGENAQGSSPGDGYSYFEFDNPDAGTKTPRTIQVGDSEQIVYDEAPARTGAWLKSGKVGVADPSLVGADPTQVDPKTLRSYQLKQQLDALAAEKFDSSKVDYSAADAAGGQAALDGAMVRAMMDQAEMDQITGTAQSNAARLAARTKAYEDESYKDITDYTGGDSGILNRYRSDIDADVGRAVADARYGQTAATNSAIRQAMRYGLNAPANTAGLATQQASQIAAAANNTRNSAIDNYRSLVGQGIGLKRDAFTTGQAATLDSMNKGEQALAGIPGR
ncbi:hypothetical protein, partial [Roseateles sp.]|uniref:hypothetical protein n=1 Tax=Roseateles sp. TaxID=1971397 RepID=UPI002DFD2139|nr:hypothetical protein [Roseateles sp.]